MLMQVVSRWQILLGAAVASMPLLAVVNGQSSNRSARVALYASVGEELTVYNVDDERATLTRQSSVTLPGFVQEAWASPSTPYLYVAWSNGGASYAGTGVPAVGDKHGVTAFRIDSATGALRAHGAGATIRSRPIHVTG